MLEGFEANTEIGSKVNKLVPAAKPNEAATELAAVAAEMVVPAGACSMTD